MCEFLDLVIKHQMPYGPQMGYLKAANLAYDREFSDWDGGGVAQMRDS